MPDDPVLITPTEANLDGAIASAERSIIDMKICRHRGLERVDPAAFTALLTAVRQLSHAAVDAYSSAGRSTSEPWHPTAPR